MQLHLWRTRPPSLVTPISLTTPRPSATQSTVHLQNPALWPHRAGKTSGLKDAGAIKAGPGLNLQALLLPPHTPFGHQQDVRHLTFHQHQAGELVRRNNFTDPSSQSKTTLAGCALMPHKTPTFVPAWPAHGPFQLQARDQD